MKNSFNEELLVDLKHVYVVFTKANENTEYKIAIVSPKKPRKAYYVSSKKITTNANTKTDVAEEFARIISSAGSSVLPSEKKGKIDNYEAQTFKDFISNKFSSDGWYEDRINMKSIAVKIKIKNRDRVSIKELISFEEIFNDKNFKTEEEKKRERILKQKEKEDEELDMLFR